MKRILTLLLPLLCALAASAYPWSLPERADTAVWFVNIYPGSEIFELEGHSAIVVSVPGRPAVAYNYGVFDFDSPNFVGRFVKGETDYMTVEWPYDPFMAEYYMSGRRVVAHELALDSVARRRLLGLLSRQVLPKNRTYRYNYVKDNCATRPLAAVEEALGDSIILAPAPYEANSFPRMTFRNIMRHYHRNYPWYQFGIDLALGSGIDYTLSRREAAFAPAELDGMLGGAMCGGKPLTAGAYAVNDVAPDAAVKSATPWYASPLAVCWAVFALALCLTVRDVRRRRVTRWFDALFFGIMGLVGCLLTFLIFVSVHEATSPNYLYIWLNPLCLLPTILIWLKKCKSALFYYQIVNFVALFLLAAAWSFVPQSANAAFLPLFLADMLRSANYIYLNK